MIRKKNLLVACLFIVYITLCFIGTAYTMKHLNELCTLKKDYEK